VVLLLVVAAVLVGKRDLAATLLPVGVVVVVVVHLAALVAKAPSLLPVLLGLRLPAAPFLTPVGARAGLAATLP
jgi:hypothetical protein